MASQRTLANRSTGERAGVDGARAPIDIGPPVRDAKARVSAFLSQVEVQASQQREQLTAALHTVDQLSDELARLREDRDDIRRQLRDVQAAYDADLRERGERIGELTTSLLNDKLAGHMERMHAVVEAQYETRREQLEAALAEREQALADARDERDAARQDLHTATARAAEQLEALKQRHANDEEVFATQLAEIRTQVAAQFDERLAQLTATVQERDRLLAQANEMTETLQREIERLRAGASDALEQARRAHGDERQQHLEEIKALKDERRELSQQNKSLERIVDAKDDLRRMKAFEKERRELVEAAEQRERKMTGLVSALTLLRDACTKSPAARSILKGAADVDLDQLFSEID